MAELAERNKNYRQLLIKKFFEQLQKIDKNTKVAHYFDNSKGIGEAGASPNFRG